MKRKPSKFVIFISAIFGIIIGITITFGAFYYYKFEKKLFMDTENLMQSGYYSAEEIFTLAGFSPGEDMEDGSISYKKVIDTVPVTLSINPERTVVTKNKCRYSIEDKMILANELLYIEKSSLEEILGCTITVGEDDTFQLTEKARLQMWYETESPLIAHAGGGILKADEEKNYTQYIYTNSLEAFKLALENEYTLFEFDFELSENGILYATHDPIDEFQEDLDEEEWKDYKIQDQFSTMTIDELLRELVAYPEIYLVLDLKNARTEEGLNNCYKVILEAAAKYPSANLLDRIIPQIYHFEEYDMIMKHHKWKSIIFTLYRLSDFTTDDIANFVKERENIHVITIPHHEITEEFCKGIHDVGCRVYTHTLNETEELYKYMNIGADGFYTDTITPAAYQQRYVGVRPH